MTLAGTGDGDLFVQFGTQPTTGSYACRPYADGSDETCEFVVPAGATQAFISVNGYSAASVTIRVDVGGATSDRYAFNDKAVALQYLKVDVDSIGESATEADGHLGSQINRYTHTDRCEYVLELDGAGKIIGGEWVGSSKRFRPDFAWLPVRVGAGGSHDGRRRQDPLRRREEPARRGHQPAGPRHDDAEVGDAVSDGEEERMAAVRVVRAVAP